MRKLRFLSVLSIIGYFCLFTLAYAQEHPEHPTTKTKQEHPKAEHPEHPQAKRAISTAELENKIKEIIDQKSKASGSFRLDDPVTKSVWMLKLDKVHSDRLTQLDPVTYFACVDMNASDGRKVDVDFFLKDRGGKLEMTDVTVHKIDGVPRYNWAEQCFWKRVEI
jgi:hypothetical protein